MQVHPKHNHSLKTRTIICRDFCRWPGILFAWSPAQAQAEPPLPPDTACKLCHVDTTGQHAFASGEVLTATVDLDALAASVHGSDAAQPVYCTDCHQDRRRYLYPHQTAAANDA